VNILGKILAGKGPADLLGAQFQLTFNNGPNVQNHVVEGNSSKEEDEVYGTRIGRVEKLIIPA
jgi:hypothetical protein